MIKLKFFSVILFFISLYLIHNTLYITPALASTEKFWSVQSIDTMKYSRDVARQVKNDPSFDQIIDRQVRQIAETGATHVSVSTPYDEEFFPVLERWVKAARKYRINVWFRGNFSGWEGWFGYAKIDRADHLELTKNFVVNHTNIFADGDIFTSCPECENGGPGDPRKNRDVSGHRRFLIDEYSLLVRSFNTINKQVTVNYFSMNGDVARLIMDRETTSALGGVVTIDHYVASPETLISDIKDLASRSGGSIVLGEMGVPIPDINGKMTQEEQADWLKKAFTQMVATPELIGLNYWVGVGGSTEIWNGKGDPTQAVSVIHNFFSPPAIELSIKNTAGRKVSAQVNYLERGFMTDTKGYLKLPFIGSAQTAAVSQKGYKPLVVDINSPGKISIELEPEHKNIGYSLQLLTYRLVSGILGLIK